MKATIMTDNKTYNLEDTEASLIIAAIEKLNSLENSPPEVFFSYAPVVLDMIHKYYDYM